MFKTILRRARQFSRRIQVRVILYAVLNVLALALATMLGPIIPPGFSDLIGADAVDPILQILATSMLAVVTFSLTIMVTGFSRAEGQWTPRSHILLREDTVTHSVLATFLGSYLYALIAIILRAADLFGENEMVVVFGMTLFVIATIIFSIIRWIVHLEGFGSLTITARQMEARAAEVVRDAAQTPAQCANPLTEETKIPKDAQPLRAAQPGYVQQVFEAALQQEAEEHEARVYVVASVGAYVQRGDVVLRVVAGDLPDAAAEGFLGNVQISDTRTFDMDPVFGVTVLAEIATRALSPGVNDPGTAIDIIHRLSRVIAEARTEPEMQAVQHDRVWIAPMALPELFAASFDPIGRCAGAAVEVHVAIQHALASIARVSGDDLGQLAEDAAAAHFDRARAMISHPGDLTRLEKVAPSQAAGS